jgi:hypothetical protein
MAGNRAETYSTNWNLIIKVELRKTNFAIFRFRMNSQLDAQNYFPLIFQVVGFENVSPLPELFLPKLHVRPSHPLDFTTSTIQDGTLLHLSLTSPDLDPNTSLHIWLQIAGYLSRLY